MNKDIESETSPNVHPITKNPKAKHHEQLLSATVALVLETEQGEALNVYCEANDTQYKVLGHLNTVTKLQSNDKVTITVIEQGVVITGRLRAENEKPTVAFTQNDDGSLILEAGKKLTLKTLNGKIEISETGHIVITGTKIDSIATDTNQIKGKKIELNC